MDTRIDRTWKSFYKMLIYTALFVAATEVQTAGSLDLIKWETLATAVGIAVVKAALTWFNT